MPLFTPSRLAIIVVSFSLITFFWTFGLPRPLAAPTLPVIDHYDHKNVHTEPIIPAPDKHATAQGSDGPVATGVPGFEEDGGRWDDKANGTDATNGTNATPVKAKPKPYKEIVQAPTHNVADYCKHVKGAQHVMVVIRTSKSEMKEKLPTHLKNLLECVPNFAIFSDHADEIEGYEVHNALEPISGDTKRNHNEFREYQLMHADAEHKPDAGKTKDLDKWKFLPMVYQAYHLRPSARFFVFIEADTSLSWTNLLQWVGRLDYRIPYHSGAPTFMGGIQISQRGSGIMLSQGALRRYVKSYDELYESKWEAQIAKECCGDLLLSMALNDAHVELYPSWPMLQNEQPSTLDYTQKLWCVPAVSWHSLVGDELSGMWDNEKRWVEARGWKEPYLYRDAFHDHVESHLEAQKADWDNLSQDTKIVAPQGRQQQLKEEEERKKKHEEEEAQKKKAEDDRAGEEKAQADKDKKKALHATKADKETGDGKASSKPKPKPKPKPKTDTDATKPKPKPKSKAKTDDSKSRKAIQKRDDESSADAPDWDKLAETFADAGDSADRCQKACTDVRDCLQWRYTTFGDGECHLGKVLRLGKKADGDVKWTSGWLSERAGKVTEEWKCENAEWKFYQ
ncbi:glycosyltransferase family 31 protein [Plenodomus tracheiphilus IPT5]|uniref:Glycosyltransferase family 31 protein n=1 Tax=Plenodomus tracheiphilus IPT5 TaxID=1408161 RepID=A0A6A7AWJ9_9PLEO|nr:glycosyltransferase family 31 protein [Plenodomus tracheiphilus IPT5]